MPAQPSRKAGQRADARHNRERVLAVAREAFTTRGIDVPLTTIARRAGVGPATLYRHFPTRAALVTEAFAGQLALCVKALDDALEDPDPWHGLCAVVEKVCAMQAVDRGFTAAFLSEFPDAVDHARVRARAEEGLALLVRRAKDAGRLREDFDTTDITLLFLANSAVAAGESRQVSLAASRRLVAYLLHSFRADTVPGAGPADTSGGAAPLPPPAPLELRQLHQGTA